MPAAPADAISAHRVVEGENGVYVTRVAIQGDSVLETVLSVHETTVTLRSAWKMEG